MEDRDPTTLDIRSEPVHVTPELIVANLTLGGSSVRWPPQILTRLHHDVLDPHVKFPLTVKVTRIFLSIDPAPTADPPQTVWSRVSIFGGGWGHAFPVSLKWNNAFGFAGASIPLPPVTVDSGGFFRVDVVHKTVHRR